MSSSDQPTNRPTFISRDEIGRRLKLSAQEVSKAIDLGLIPAETNHRVNRAVFARAKLSGTALRKKLREAEAEPHRQNNKLVDTDEARRLLNVSASKLHRLLRLKGIHPSGGYTDSKRKWIPLYSRSVITVLAESLPPAQDEKERQELVRAHNAAINERVQVHAPERAGTVHTSTLYLGPTNSGKTYQALEALIQDYTEADGKGSFIYAGPLRMLAYEVYEKLAERLGEENVGFVTGEEALNPTAPVIACTVEMAPMSGTTLVLDEAHWLVDEERGDHWAKMLTSAHYENLRIVAAPEVKHLLLRLTSDALYEQIVVNERKLPLNYAGECDLFTLPPRTAVVAFSRKNVLAIAHMLHSVGRKVGVLYGALPLKVREQQIAKFVAGEYDLIVCTDVIGHGVNLPIDNVAFAQTNKFDGETVRPLKLWELAQIAGRAGRFGLSDGGNVYSATGVEWFEVDESLLVEGVRVAGGLRPSDLSPDTGFLAPTFEEAAPLRQSHVGPSLEAWQAQAAPVLAPSHLAPSVLRLVHARLTGVASILGGAAVHPATDVPEGYLDAWGALRVEELWRLVFGPYLDRGFALSTLSLLLADEDRRNDGGRWARARFQSFTQTQSEGPDALLPLETLSAVARELRMGCLTFSEDAPSLEGLLPALDEAIKKAEEALPAKLDEMVATGYYGVCQNCGGWCAPWSETCSKCSDSR